MDEQRIVWLRSRRTIALVAFVSAMSAIAFLMMDVSFAAYLVLGLVAVAALVNFVQDSRELKRERNRIDFASIKFMADGLIRRDVQ